MAAFVFEPVKFENWSSASEGQVVDKVTKYSQILPVKNKPPSGMIERLEQN
jgi:hypothetical protein